MCFIQSLQAVKFIAPRLVLAAMSAIVAICVSATGPACAADTDFHYLAADPSLRAGMQNTNVTMGQATYHGQVLALDQPWESGYTLGGGSTVTDPDTGQLRMYYELNNPHSGVTLVAMATSNDGVHWTKPALNVTGTRYTNDPSNNFVNIPQTWARVPCVFIDPTAPAGSPRYRMSALDQLPPWNIYSLTSSDGVNWNSTGTIDAWGSQLALDSLNITMLDARTQKYTLYGRCWYNGRRGVYMKQSDTWDGTWTGERQFILDPADVVPPGGTPFDIYSSCIQTYHGQYIGLPSLYFHPDGGSGPIYPTFMYSRDGEDFSFDDPYHPIIDLSAHGQNEQTCGMAFSGTTMVERNGLLHIYYEYYPFNHSNPDQQFSPMYLATLPVDRFVGIQSLPGSVGEWTTSTITLPDDPGHLILNALVNGSVRVEVLDPATGQPFPGYGEDDAIGILSGDFLDALAQWNGADNLNSLAGQMVELRFLMNDATIYSFHFEAVPEPSTLALLASGLIGLLCYAWRKRK